MKSYKVTGWEYDIAEPLIWGHAFHEDTVKSGFEKYSGSVSETIWFQMTLASHGGTKNIEQLSHLVRVDEFLHWLRVKF